MLISLGAGKSGEEKGKASKKIYFSDSKNKAPSRSNTNTLIAGTPDIVTRQILEGIEDIVDLSNTIPVSMDAFHADIFVKR